VKFFILGATGGIGKHLVAIALKRGHEVTAYVRSQKKVEIQDSRLKVVEGNVFDAEQMGKRLRGHDVVLSAFGPRTILSSTLRRQFGRALIAALKRGGVHRVQVVSAAFLFPNLGPFARLLTATLFRQMAPDMSAMEAEIRQPDLDWTLVRPPRLTNGRAKHHYRVADGTLPRGGTVISREDVAHFMIAEAETPKHAKQIVGICD
jgi:putative NADH-flavin reductase